MMPECNLRDAGLIKNFARPIKKSTANIVTFCPYQIISGVAQGNNSNIMPIKRRAGAYRNREEFRRAIFFCFGGLDFYPR